VSTFGGRPAAAPPEPGSGAILARRSSQLAALSAQAPDETMSTSIAIA
jgi:hypothetical protein